MIGPISGGPAHSTSRPCWLEELLRNQICCRQQLLKPREKADLHQQLHGEVYAPPQNLLQVFSTRWRWTHHLLACCLWLQISGCIILGVSIYLKVNKNDNQVRS